MKIKVGVVGCTGNMGKTVIQELVINTQVKLVGAVARACNAYVGLDAGLVAGHNSNIEVKITSSINDVFFKSDIVIDFTNKECMLKCLEMAVKWKKPLVSGTTGVNSADLQKYAAEVPVFWSANMSVGANILFKLVNEAAKLLGDEYDVEIWEMHHSAKKDSPSGTAIALGKSVANAFKRDLVLHQHTHSDLRAREKGTIGFAVSRGGGVIGDHSVMFANSDERVEIAHKAITRNLFAKGAIRAAVWLYENKREAAGLYSMLDII